MVTNQKRQSQFRADKS